jgi:hypothetical protein
MEAMMGTTMMPRAAVAANAVKVPVPQMEAMMGDRTKRATRPKTMDGMPARISMAGLKTGELGDEERGTDAERQADGDGAEGDLEGALDEGDAAEARRREVRRPVGAGEELLEAHGAEEVPTVDHEGEEDGGRGQRGDAGGGKQQHHDAAFAPCAPAAAGALQRRSGCGRRGLWHGGPRRSGSWEDGCL